MGRIIGFESAGKLNPNGFSPQGEAVEVCQLDQVHACDNAYQKGKLVNFANLVNIGLVGLRRLVATLHFAATLRGDRAVEVRQLDHVYACDKACEKGKLVNFANLVNIVLVGLRRLVATLHLAAILRGDRAVEVCQLDHDHACDNAYQKGKLVNFANLVNIGLVGLRRHVTTLHFAATLLLAATSYCAATLLLVSHQRRWR